jgi:hypothetical protein
VTTVKGDLTSSQVKLGHYRTDEGSVVFAIVAAVSVVLPAVPWPLPHAPASSTMAVIAAIDRALGSRGFAYAVSACGAACRPAGTRNIPAPRGPSQLPMENSASAANTFSLPTAVGISAVLSSK